MIAGVIKGMPIVMQAVQEMGNAEGVSPEVAIASGYAWASLKKELAKLEGQPAPTASDLTPADTRLKAGVFLDPANAPHGFDTIELSVTMTAAEGGILVSVAKNMGVALGIPSTVEMSEKIFDQVMDGLGEHRS